MNCKNILTNGDLATAINEAATAELKDVESNDLTSLSAEQQACIINVLACGDGNAGSLAQAFSWMDTPQGYDFWFSERERLNNKLPLTPGAVYILYIALYNAGQ